METVQANLSVRTATVARFEALKAFIPLMDLPQLQVGLSRVTGPVNGSQSVIFPDTTLGTPFLNQAGLVNAELNRFNLFLPLDPSGHITALPIAEEGIRAKELMEQLVRRAQAVLAAQRYFEAKQIGYGQRVADADAYVASETLGLVQRKLREKQAHDVELSQARVDVGRARVLVADLGKAERNAEAAGSALPFSSAGCWCPRISDRCRSTRSRPSSSTLPSRTLSTWAWCLTSRVAATTPCNWRSGSGSRCG